ncbi:MAG: amidohydrolase [Ruminococcaceae bacterium]|nr:amidohydrolase [Oscillospiraceae bacterium]
MTELATYAQKLREELHTHPEIGYELTRTLAVVHRELDAMGISYTDKYCRSSVVAYINPGKAFTIGLRADMDALPIQEETDVPFRSQNPGKMHACGHDAHTAILLAAAKKLKAMEHALDCTVKLIFSPAEEYADPGCQHLAENGVMEDVDCAIAMHVASDNPAGQIIVNDGGGLNANSASFTADFHGVSCHAASQQNGKDAILMAIDAITAMEFMIAKEVDGRKVKVMNIGAIHGGEVANVVCNHVNIRGTLRTWDDDVNDFILGRLEQICNAVAAQAGGRAEFKVTKFMPYVLGNPIMQKKLRETAAKLVGEENVRYTPRTMGGEDFAFLTRKKPCGHFKVGVKPPDMTGKNTAHTATYRLDNGVFAPAIAMFVNFVLENQNGMEL